MFIRVDLPEPDAPMIDTKSLRFTSRSTPVSTCTVAGPTV